MEYQQDQLFPEPPRTDGKTLTALKKIFEDLEQAGQLDPITAVKRPVLELAAESLDRSFQGPKSPSVATSNIFKQFMESLETLPVTAEVVEADIDALDHQLMKLTSQALDEWAATS